MKYLNLFSFCVSAALLVTACKKEDPTGDDEMSDEQLQEMILNDFSDKVAYQNYQDLENNMAVFYAACQSFDASGSDADLDAARKGWKDARAAWEQSEAFLFGPVSTENIDPSTDTWPVDYPSLDSLLQTGNAFTQAYLNSLGDELKGYHPAEYLLWGADGSKVPSAFTSREREYLIALSADLHLKVTQLRMMWDPSVSGNYSWEVIHAGEQGGVYATRRAVFEEFIGGMIGICDEVANGKIEEPFAMQDPSLEESPFSGNSLTDFRNNIQGVKNVYLGMYSEDGYGIHSLLEKNNLALHNKVMARLDAAIDAFDGITVPFGDAISSQPTQVQHVIDQINALRTVLEDDLMPFVQQSVLN
ncbi:MAG: hypothetical protein H6585_11365 [Flavobacteriales bacterium]|nr:hypothetical protein [Flavobacteriales bacterium]MCB9448933.1 hypothetical protein [Flavobacteriales bacterium]